jgi:hypothetical protein
MHPPFAMYLLRAPVLGDCVVVPNVEQRDLKATSPEVLRLSVAISESFQYALPH